MPIDLSGMEKRLNYKGESMDTLERREFVNIIGSCIVGSIGISVLLFMLVLTYKLAVLG